MQVSLSYKNFVYRLYTIFLFLQTCMNPQLQLSSYDPGKVFTHGIHRCEQTTNVAILVYRKGVRIGRPHMPLARWITRVNVYSILAIRSLLCTIPISQNVCWMLCDQHTTCIPNLSTSAFKPSFYILLVKLGGGGGVAVLGEFTSCCCGIFWIRSLREL